MERDLPREGSPRSSFPFWVHGPDILHMVSRVPKTTAIAAVSSYSFPEGSTIFSALKDWIQYFSANSVKMSNWGDQYTLSVYILHIRNEGGQYFHCSQLEKFIQIRLGHNPMNAIK
jgi:hypothetical protein